MFTVINILVTLNRALSTSKKTISNVILCSDCARIQEGNRVPTFYPCWADFSVCNWYLSTAFVFPVCLSWGCGLNMVLITWSMWKYCGENQIFCFWTQNGALFPEAALDGGPLCLLWGRTDREKERSKDFFVPPRARQKGKSWQLTSAWKTKCVNSEKWKL